MSKLGFSKRDNYSRCKNSAIYSLAMREHSRQELYKKLIQKEYSEDVDLNKLLDELEARDYQSDQRFTESFIRYRVSRGQGKVKISNDLKMRGVSASLINISIQQADADWFVLASQLREKKYGKNIPHDYKEKAKQMRFLFSRGFDAEMIRYALG
ncbi:MAG: recombination regulator RecX [Cocleimonas sp.]|nr:recombination regulator RecX [Cocleimonas sp.]